MTKNRREWEHAGNIAGYEIIHDVNNEWADSIVFDCNGAVDREDMIADLLELLNRKYQ